MGEADLDPQSDFVDVYREHVWQVYGYLAYRASSRAEAEDLTQATFERAFKAWRRYDPRRASVRTWLLTIARNLLIDQRRKGGGRRSVSLESPALSEADLPSGPGPEETSLGLSPELASALEKLKARERSILALRFGGDLQTTEIAEMLDLSVANVQQILSRALRKLRQELETETGHDKAGGAGRVAGQG